jgi:hypothetical protein
MKTLITVTLSMFCFLNVLLSQPWTEVTSGVTTPLTSVSNYDNINVWICGNNGVVLRSTNNGYNISNVSGNGLPSIISLVNIFGVSGSTALTAGYIGTTTYVYKTSNSGANWDLVFTQPNGFINGIWFNGSVNGFMTGNPVGGRWSLWKTTNGGNNWDSTGMYLAQRNGEIGWNNSLFRNGNETWFGTDKARIYHSLTGSAPWDSQSTGGNTNIRVIYVRKEYTPYIGYAGGDSLSRTTNNGSQWNMSRAAGSNLINGFAFLPSGFLAWYSRNNGNIYFKQEGDTIWHAQYTAPSGNYLHLSALRPDLVSWYGNVFAVRDNGGISKCFYALEGINIVSNETSHAFSLSQNYPNPFNPVTNFGFRIADFGMVKLSINDVIGREVTVLLNKEMKPGSYEVNWDASAYPSGVYFYKLTANGFTDTKKMVLIK